MFGLCQTLILTTIYLLTDNQPLELNGRLQALETGDLLIAAVRESVAGKYSCVRANEAGQVKATGYLSVLGKSAKHEVCLQTRYYVNLYISFNYNQKRKDFLVSLFSQLKY